MQEEKMKIKQGDFLSVDYTGTIQDTGQTFDTTNIEVAKKEKIFNEKVGYGPITICVGQNQILPEIDKALINKDENKSFKLELSSDEAFGKKNAKLIRLVPANVFKKQGIQVFVGLEVQIDSLPGIIRSMSGGRVLVDFNHPLAGRNLAYEIKINKIITDDAKKIASYIKLIMGVNEPKVEIKESKAIIEMEIVAQVSKTLSDKIKELVPKIKTVEFVSKKTTPK